jgi:hypothetical protein
VTIHFQRVPEGGSLPPAEPGWWKARYFLDGQKYGATFPCPDDIGALADELQVKANELGVDVQLLTAADDRWMVLPPVLVTRYAFVVRWPDGREPELASRNGRLVVSTDKTELCPPYEPVVFTGDPRWTVGVTDQEDRRAASTP